LDLDFFGFTPFLHVEIEKGEKTRRKTVGIQKREEKGAKKGGKKATVNNPIDSDTVSVLGLLTRTLKDGYTASVIRHPYHPVGLSTPPLDGTALAVPYAITNTAAYGAETVFTVHVQMAGNRIEINRNWDGTYQKAGYNNSKRSFVIPPTLKNRQDTWHSRH
jgi:hypothetical protein